jgi:hypothetical protein
MKQIKTILIISILALTGCTKTVCYSHSVWSMKCEKKVDWSNPGFTVVRTIITNGTNAGK